MGVHGLWPILQPCARPTPLPTLNRKRLAVDASIWIYQFLKAVRDKEGNALRNSHVVGFFRRICKLLFHGIKPVFVFDGGAPVLKRQTIVGRKRRREGRREDAVRTAGKLLAVQMKRRDEEASEKRKQTHEKEAQGLSVGREDDEDIVKDGQDLVYVGEMGMSAQERQKTRKFFKKDAYHLPDLQGGIEGMGQPNDPRIMSAEELAGYAQQFNNGEEVNMYDFSKIDFDGEFFLSLPPADRYNILNAARLRSRLRMGLSHEQLKKMFPNQMDFSKFQIERVRERNDLTQRSMNLAGMNDDLGGGRIAGDRNREYVLVKNDGVEGGWALGVVSTDKTVGERSKPIDIEALTKNVIDIEDSDDDEEFEDVPIDGVKHLPKIKPRANNDDALWEDHSLFEDSSRADRASQNNVDTLFVDEANNVRTSTVSDLIFDEEDEELNRAIALSMQQSSPPSADLHPGETEEEAHIRKAIALSMGNQQQSAESDDSEDFEDVPLPEYEQRAVEPAKPIGTTNGKAVAHIVNSRANASVPKRKQATAFAIDSDSDSDLDMQAALARARKQKAPNKPKPFVPASGNTNNPFGGLLPFESIPLKSLFQKTAPVVGVSATDAAEYDDRDMEGGFTKDLEEDKAKPLPPWLLGNGDIRNEFEEQQRKDRALNAEDQEQALEEERLYRKNRAPIRIDSDEESENDSDVEIVDAPPAKVVVASIESVVPSFSPAECSAHEMSLIQETSESSVPAKDAVETMAEVAEDIRALPPVSDIPQHRQPSEEPASTMIDHHEEEVDWSESDYGETTTKIHPGVDSKHPAGGVTDIIVSKSPSVDLGKADMAVHEMPATNASEAGVPTRSESPVFADGDSVGQYPHTEPGDGEETEAAHNNNFDDFSDPEDEELFAQLAIEAEEHARFASTLNNKSAQENHAAYESELKALRSQQKKDRRDADEVSHIMITECQALLRLFGLPYVTAPMEAEAQCAELVNLGLVDGVVTDDCDIFLFGGTRVYKNMFNSNKFVECYLSSDIEKELSITRDQLIGLAHLLGSDYTEGLPGIGPVTALEILSEFPNSNTGLEEFKEWWVATQMNGQKPNQETTTFRKKFKRAQSTKLFLPSSFPSSAVTEAYWKPDVDSTPEPFQWGVPDLDQLREFLMATIGWSQERTDEVLVPVIRDMNQRERDGTQANITRFFQGGVGAGANTGEGAGQNIEKGSKRMKEAVNKLKAKKQGAVGTGTELATYADKAAEWAEREKKRSEREKKKAAAGGTGKRKGKKRVATVATDDDEDEDDEENGDESDDDDDVNENETGRSSGSGKQSASRKRARL